MPVVYAVKIINIAFARTLEMILTTTTTKMMNKMMNTMMTTTTTMMMVIPDQADKSNLYIYTWRSCAQ